MNNALGVVQRMGRRRRRKGRNQKGRKTGRNKRVEYKGGKKLSGQNQ